MKKLIADWKERGPFPSRECRVWWEVLKAVLETRRLAKQQKMKTHREVALSSHSSHAGGAQGRNRNAIITHTWLICTTSRHFLQNRERQEETWGMMQQQIYSSHRPQPPRTKSFYLLKPSREESFRSRCSLNQPVVSWNTGPWRKSPFFLFFRSVPSSLLKLQRWKLTLFFFKNKHYPLSPKRTVSKGPDQT